MTCYYPRKGYRLPGTNKYVPEKPKGHSGAAIEFGCKQCIGCKLDYESEWATRMVHENQMHDESMFLTLTYSPENLPENYSLVPRHLQLFWKKVRKKYPELKIRYVGCGEYGNQTHRPHYHAILFGYEAKDLEQVGTNGRGDALYSSEEMDKLWGFGHVTIGKVTYESCAYVARYMLKNSGADMRNDDYSFIDESTGEIIIREQKPFIRQSRKPGIGLPWFEKYKSDVFPHDHVIIEGRKRPVPGYYLKKLAECDEEQHQHIKEKREGVINSKKFRQQHTPSRLHVKEEVKKAKLNIGKKGSVLDPV